MEFLAFVGIFWIAPMVVGHFQGEKRKCGGGVGVAAAIILGWIGVILVMLFSKRVESDAEMEARIRREIAEEKLRARLRNME